MLTKDQEKHLNKIIIRTSERQIHKYTLGAAEHGGNLWDMPVEELADEALNEVIDMGAYLVTLIDQLKKLTKENKELKQKLIQYGEPDTLSQDQSS